MQELETDVLVIGYGGAGASAAIEAHDAGAQVILLEKMPQPGGNTRL
jgi:fumarate reductase flavoprotein subunit